MLDGFDEISPMYKETRTFNASSKARRH